MRLSHHPTPNFEAIIYDERDRTAVDPSSSLGWFATADDALNFVAEYVSDTAGLYRWEVRSKTGVLLHFKQFVNETHSPVKERSMRHGLYGIFWREDRDGRTNIAMWAMERNQRRAIRHGRRLRAIVTRMNLPEGGGAWDAPTFRACSDVVADYRPKP